MEKAVTWSQSMARPLLWILCLAFLAVGARNFEEGVSADAGLYAHMARTINRTHDWFHLVGGNAEMNPFVEHPHLGFWLLALVFKVAPAADWSARMVGHVFYVLFLWMFFLYIRRDSNSRVATASVLILWIWPRFSNFFSNIYLDPGTLFFGAAAVFGLDVALSTGKRALGVLAGVSFSLCLMYKGMTAGGFAPALVLVALLGLAGKKHSLKSWLLSVGLFLGAALLVLAAYVWAVRHSSVPQFFDLYFQRQWFGRFAHHWDWSMLYSDFFWRELMKDTAWMTPLALISLLKKNRSHGIWICFALFLGFYLTYAPNHRVGVQYWLMLMPWIAWGIAQGLFKNFSFPSARVAQVTAIFAIVAVMVIQYLPYRTHGNKFPQPLLDVERLKKENAASKLILDMSPDPFEIFFRDSYYWYLDMPIELVEKDNPIPKAEKGTVYMVLENGSPRIQAIQQSGWCLRYNYPPRNSLWLPCSNS